MQLISHRRNSIKQLEATDSKYGVEVDIRTYKGDLIIHHDPFAPGENLERWLDHYEHGTLILNVKEEGLEKSILELLSARSLKDFFFLDQSFPFLVNLANLGETRCAVRVSEFESIQTALSLAKKISWVWLDCFTRFPISLTEYEQLKNSGFKLCLVSPELQGRNPELEIPLFAELIEKNNMKDDAVCTKKMEIWEACIAL